MDNQNATPHKIFFSYSRTDGEQYALKLANDLRNAGADVWIDQLDIEAGKLWDLEVEKALNAANCVLFIATEKSTTSNNVLDEVYYALEENKAVIPLCFHECRIPFRLQRLQRIDFTQDYQTAFQRLLKTLALKEEHSIRPPKDAGTTAAKTSSVAPPSNETASPEPRLQNDIPPHKQGREEDTRSSASPYKEKAVVSGGSEGGKSKKPLLWGAGLVAVAALLFFLLKSSTGTDKSSAVLEKNKVERAPKDSALVSGVMQNSGGAVVIDDSAKKKGDAPIKKRPELLVKTVAKINIPNPVISAAGVLQKLEVRVRTDASDTRNSKIAYLYSISAPSKDLNAISEVRYQRNHPNFPLENTFAKYSSSTDRGSNFSFKGYQGIRIQSVFVTIVMKDGTTSERTLKPIVYEAGSDGGK